MNLEQALPHLRADGVDNALSPRKASERPADARLIGWQCGNEPMFIAVWSYLPGRLDDDEAIDLAIDYLDELKWFADKPTRPDYVI